MKPRPHFDHEDARKLDAALRKIEQPDLIVLKASASIEHLIYCLFAARLGGDPKHLPDLGAKRATDLAFFGLNERQFTTILETLRSIRNQVAHEIDPPSSEGLNEFVRQVNDWSSQHNEECAYQLSLAEPHHSTEIEKLRSALLAVFNHLCHLREHAMKRPSNSR